jgi:lysophospholipase L1-like esterase
MAKSSSSARKEPGAGAAGAKRGAGHSAPPARRRKLYRLLSVLLGLAGAWLLAELVLLFYTPAQMQTKLMLVRMPQGPSYHCYTSNPHGELQPLPDVRQGSWKLYDSMLAPNELPLDALARNPYCVEYQISPQGLRDRIYPKLPPEGVLRIVGTGDSFAAGEGVPLELSLFKQIERKLGAGYEVVNAASSGIDTQEEAFILRLVSEQLHGRRAIVVFIVNDVRQTPELQRRQAYIHDLINVRDRNLQQHVERTWFTGGSKVLQLVASYVELQRIRQGTINWYRDCYNPRLNGENLRLLQSDFRSLATIPDCQVALVMYPLLEELEADRYLFQDIHDQVRSMAVAAGLPVLDLAPVFLGHDSQSLQVHPSDHHPNGRAHQMAAEAIVHWLQQDVPGFLNPPDPVAATP